MSSYRQLPNESKPLPLNKEGSRLKNWRHASHTRSRCQGVSRHTGGDCEPEGFRYQYRLGLMRERKRTARSKTGPLRRRCRGKCLKIQRLIGALSLRQNEVFLRQRPREYYFLVTAGTTSSWNRLLGTAHCFQDFLQVDDHLLRIGLNGLRVTLRSAKHRAPVSQHNFFGASHLGAVFGRVTRNSDLISHF
jgi:hypothetical protein